MCSPKRLIWFTEANPDKGTETVILSLLLSHARCLQKLTPIRERKLTIIQDITLPVFSFTEANPDKGTETVHYKPWGFFLNKVYRS